MKRLEELYKQNPFQTFVLAGGVGLALAAAKKRRAKQGAAEQG